MQRLRDMSDRAKDAPFVWGEARDSRAGWAIVDSGSGATLPPDKEFLCSSTSCLLPPYLRSICCRAFCVSPKSAGEEAGINRPGGSCHLDYRDAIHMSKRDEGHAALRQYLHWKISSCARSSMTQNSGISHPFVVLTASVRAVLVPVAHAVLGYFDDAHAARAAVETALCGCGGVGCRGEMLSGDGHWGSNAH